SRPSADATAVSVTVTASESTNTQNIPVKRPKPIHIRLIQTKDKQGLQDGPHWGIMVLPKFLSKSSRKHRSSNSTSNPSSPSPSASFTSPQDSHNHPSIPLRHDSEPRSPAS